RRVSRSGSPPGVEKPPRQMSCSVGEEMPEVLRSNPLRGPCYTGPARMTTPLPLGKLRPALLGELLTRHAGADPRVVVGPRVGEDAAVLDMGDRYLVATTDPITFVT